MSKLKHTPGPWSRCMANDGQCPCGLIFDSTGELLIAKVMSTCEEHEPITGGYAIHLGSEEHIANTRLVEKAPEYQDIVIKLVKWNKKYPSNRIFSHGEIVKIAKEMESIYQESAKVIEEATGLPIEEVLKDD